MDAANCRNCGNSLIANARFCPRCGVATAIGPPSAVAPDPSQPLSNPGEFPPPRAQELSEQAPYPQPPHYQQQFYQQQPHQQTTYQQQGYLQPYYQQPVVYYSQPKDKSVALLLAIFLGFWTWLYTYKKDAWKFWLSLGLHLTVFNPLWTWIVLLLPNIALSIWSIIDVAVKPDEFYRNYPNA